MNYNAMSAQADKLLQPDGSVVTRGGEFVEFSNDGRALAYSQTSAQADKLLQPDGSIVTRNGETVSPPNSQGIMQYAAMSPEADKLLQPDGSIVTRIGDSVSEISPIRSADYRSMGYQADKLLQPDGSVITRDGMIVSPANLSRSNFYDSATAKADKLLQPNGTIQTRGGVTPGPNYVKDGMVLHFDGINNAGTGHSDSATMWKDSSGNGHDGIISGLEFFAWEPKALYSQVTAANLNANVNSSLNLNGSPRTYYFTISDVATTSAVTLGDTTGTATNDGIFVYNTYTEKRVTAAGRTRILYAFTGEPIKNYAIAIDMDYFKLYVNGELYQSIANLDGLNGSTLRLFGGKSPTQSSKSMKMYNFIAYNRALTDTEIQQNYNVDKDRFGIPLISQSTMIRRGIGDEIDQDDPMNYSEY